MVELHHLVAELEARSLADLPGLLGEVEDSARAGRWVAGFVSYEAAPAFDPAFQVHQKGQETQLPLAWFGVFEEARPAEDLAACPEAAERGADWSGEIDAADHARSVSAIRQAAAAGDVYLANYTTRFRRSWRPGEDALDLYRRLVTGHAGGWHAFLETDEWAVACGSPELFFEFVDGALVTRPMKGTARRGRWPAEDAIRARELSRSPKERAENVMVVDLVRNDMGRIAVPGSVDARLLWAIERHPTLWQLTSSVTARSPSGVGLAEVFAALFPCASVTGAPKISAMSIISGLERSPRGVYCGAVGVVEPGQDGLPHRARFAVAIRTAVVNKATASAAYGSGGGITWYSDPLAEWEEVQLKTRVLTEDFPPTRHGLIETMGFDPGLGRGAGGIRNLDGHLARLAASADYFGIGVPADLAGRLADAVNGVVVASRVRLLLGADGHVDISVGALGESRSTVIRLCVDPEPVHSGEITLFHKTTDRRRYDLRANRHPGADDVVIVNERGEVSETTRANLAVRIDDRWCTPPLDSGLLPGVERSRLVRAGVLAERAVTVEELLRASEVATLSSLRGWRVAQVRPRCECLDSPPETALEASASSLAPGRPSCRAAVT